MKTAIISVWGGVAAIEENFHDLDIEIVDFDLDDNELTEDEMKQYDAVVYVRGGVAEVVFETDGVKVEVKDFDNDETKMFNRNIQ